MDDHITTDLPFAKLFWAWRSDILIEVRSLRTPQKLSEVLDGWFGKRCLSVRL